MHNVTFITFNANNNSFTQFVNSSEFFGGIDKNVTADVDTSDVVFLLNENVDATGGYHFRSSFSIALMIVSWAFMLLGFTFCCCSQLCERKPMGVNVANDGNETTAGNETTRNEDNDGTLETDRANNSSDVAPDILRRYDVDLESLPSYTIVSGLPTYDDALEEFRKAGIILTPQIPIIKIFESPDPNNKEQQDGDSVDGGNNGGGETNNCTCNSSNLNVPAATANNGNPVIELSPEQLKLLSQKRLSLQISFAMPPRRNSRINLYREANRNNLLRSLESRDLTIPPIHRSASVISLSNERAILEQRLKYLQHRGSLT